MTKTGADGIAILDQSISIAAINEYGVIRVSGDDATVFLQNQLSNDLNLLDLQHAQLSSYCNPKGRILALFYVVPVADGYLLVMSRELLEQTQKRLQMFIMMSKVTLEDVSSELACNGLTIPSSSSLDIKLPQNDYDNVNTEQLNIIKLPGTRARYLVIGPQSELGKNLLNNIEVTSTDSASWFWQDIEAGLPSIWSQTESEFVPQMVNLDLINGVSFKKGCYPGQEIVARMHYLGKAKRRMFALTTDEQRSVEPGTDIYLGDSDGQSVGKVVKAQPGSEQTQMLAVLQLAKLSPDNMHLGASDGPLLSLSELPYSVNEETEA